MGKGRLALHRSKMITSDRFVSFAYVLSMARVFAVAEIAHDYAQQTNGVCLFNNGLPRPENTICRLVFDYDQRSSFILILTINSANGTPSISRSNWNVTHDVDDMTEIHSKSLRGSGAA